MPGHEGPLLSLSLDLLFQPSLFLWTHPEWLGLNRLGAWFQFQVELHSLHGARTGTFNPQGRAVPGDDSSMTARSLAGRR